jgi:hypothetical protein
MPGGVRETCMNRSLLSHARILALCAAFVPAAAGAVPVVYNFTSTFVSGDSGVDITGTVVIDSAVLTPNVFFAYPDKTGLLGAFIRVSDGTNSTEYALADINRWSLQTDAQGRLLTFGFESGSIDTCFLYPWVDGPAFVQAFYCDPEDEEDYVVIRTLVGRVQAASAVPSVSPGVLAALALLVAASALGIPAARRRLR